MENKKIYDFINKHTDKHIDEKELENVTGGEAMWLAANDREFDTCPDCRIVILSYNAKKCPECGRPFTLMKNIDIPDDWELKWYIYNPEYIKMK